MSFDNANKAVTAAGRGGLAGVPSPGYPAPTKRVQTTPRRPGAAPLPPGTGAGGPGGGWDPNRHHISMTENDQIMLGVLPKNTKKVPNRGVSKG